MINKDTVEEFWDINTLTHRRKEAFHDSVKIFLDKLRIFLCTSGKIWAAPRASIALQQFLVQTVSAKKTTVLICSFNCNDVARAIIQAGLCIDTFDFADTTGRIDWERVGEQLRSFHAAIVIPHLFGVPTDFRAVIGTAKKLGVTIIEDCAHTLGGKIGKHVAGTIGDASIFSFNYDKPISLGGGGILLVNNPELWSRIKLDDYRRNLESDEQEMILFIKYLQKRRKSIRDKFLLSIFQSVIWKMSNIVKMPTKPLSARKELFPVSGIGPLRAALGIWQLKLYSKIMNERNVNSALFSDLNRCQSWYVGEDISPAWLKQKVIPFDPEKGALISKYLLRCGFRVGLFNWPITIDKYYGLPEKPNASYISKYSLDIPIHQNMTMHELEIIRKAVCDGTLKPSFFR